MGLGDMESNRRSEDRSDETWRPLGWLVIEDHRLLALGRASAPLVTGGARKRYPTADFLSSELRYKLSIYLDEAVETRDP